MVYIELMDKAQLPLPKFPQKKGDGLGKGVFSEKSFSLNR